MFRSILFITVIALSVPVSAAVTVVESTPSRLVLLWEMRGFDTASVNVNGGDGLWTRVSYDGGYVFVGDSGAALLPGYAVHAGVPPEGAVRVSVEPDELAVVRVANPLLRRGYGSRGDDPSFSSRWVSEPSYGMFRGYRAARFVLRPVVDLGQGRVQLLRRARVVIEFPAAAHSGASWQPRGDYERMVERALVNFRVAQGWQGERRALRRSAAAKEAYPFGADQRLASFKVGDGNRNGSEGTTRENALIRISGKKIREALGLDPGVSINSIALYASMKGEMDIIVPGEGGIPAGVFEIPVLRNEKDDYLIAYVSGASDWSYDSGARQYTFKINRYDDYRTYWLAAGGGGVGASMGRFEQPPAGSFPVNESFESNVFLRTPGSLAESAHEGGIDWAWRRFSVSRADTTIRLDLPGIDESQPGQMWVRGQFGSSYASSSSMEVSLGGQRLCGSCGSGAVAISKWDGARDLSVRFSNSRFEGSAYYDLNHIQLRYSRFLNVSDTSGRFEAFSVTGDGVARYRLSKTGGGLAYVVRVTDDEREISLVDTVRGASLEWSDQGNGGARYMVSLEKDIVDYSDSLKALDRRSVVDRRYQIRDLRGANNRAGYLIVTHEDFLEAALKLAGHKGDMGFAQPKVVLLGDVLNQFGGGNTDPVALRNFLLHVYREWEGVDDLSYVLLFGSGHYDYKSVSSRAVNHMPVPYCIRNNVGDDFYVFLSAEHPYYQHKGYYFLGRLPAKSPAEAFDMVDKIIETENPLGAYDQFAVGFDSWRGRVLLAADDDQQGLKQDGAGNHTMQSEGLAAIIARQRPDIDLRKLYLFEYEWDERFFKPGATRAFISEINNGVSVVNWLGHGAPDVIADERLMEKGDVMTLYNRKRYPVFTLFSCSIGKFDRPGQDCLASMLVRQPQAGAIAVLSSAREVQAEANLKLATPFFEALYDTAGGANLSIGSALQIAKTRYTGTNDNRFYMILGDPSITLTGRSRKVDLAVTDASGARLDTLKALQQVTMRGTVTDMQGRRDETFGGPGAFVSLTLFNPPQDSARRKDGGKFTNPRYSLPGSPVFSARIDSVKNGEFVQRLLLPMNLAFGKPGVKLTAYAWKRGDTATGSGYLGGLIFEGSESGSLNDIAGPKISVRPVYGTGAMDSVGLFVRNRVTAQLPLTLEVSIEDESGINVVGSGPDEGLSMEVKGALSKRSINHLLQFSPGSFTKGAAFLTFEESELKSGAHELVISAQDLLGNVTKLSVSLEVVDPADIRLDHVINVPNPVRMGRETRFYYLHSNAPGDLNVNVTIRVYSLGGRLLAVIRNPRNGEPWVPRDGKGNLLTPNVYLYQVTASSSNIGKSAKSKIKKLAVHPPK